MGYSAWAKVMLGVKLYERDMKMNENVRGCAHTLPKGEAFAFCALCGKPLWVRGVKYLPGCKALRDGDPEDVGRSVGLGLQRIRQEGDDFIFGKVLGKTDYNDHVVRMTPPSEMVVAEVRDRITNFLADAGMSAPASKMATFGLYVLLVESY